MFRFLLVIFLVPVLMFSQKKPFKVGDRVNISADLYNELDSKTTIYIPENKYTLVFNYIWGAKDRDGKTAFKN